MEIAWRSTGQLSAGHDLICEWQNLQFQIVGEPSQAAIWRVFDIGEADQAYFEARATGKAADFARAVEISGGKHIPARRALATIAADEGHWPEALASFEQLVRDAPADADTRHRFAFAAYSHGELDLALEQWAAALEADPHHAESWYGCGIAWLGRGNFESAEKAFRKAVEFNPIHWRAREGLIEALVGEGRLADARPMRELLRSRAALLPRVPTEIKVAHLPREGGSVIVREALYEVRLTSVPWLFRIELFDQATPGGKPIKVMELRRDGEAFAWGLTGEDGVFHPSRSLAALPDLKQVLEEAK